MIQRGSLVSTVRAVGLCVASLVWTTTVSCGGDVSETAAPGATDASATTTMSFTPRPQVPRVAPVPIEGRTEAQAAMLASRPDFNIYKTLAHHPELYARWSGLGRFLLNGSSLEPREREIVMLRMGWLCQSEYEWAQHARIATESAALAPEELARIAEGPDAAGWSDFERTLLRMVDELRYEAMVSDETWEALLARYSEAEAIEALFTAAQYQLVSMALNSLGIQLDPGLEHRLPSGVAKPPLAARPERPRLPAPRLAPLRPEELSDEQRELLATQLGDGSATRRAPNLYGTLVRHPQLYTPRLAFGIYLRRDSGLPPRTRELLILRTAWNIRAEYEWAHHVEAARAAGLGDQQIARVANGPDAPGWSEEEAALLRAADELRREAFVSDATWATLEQHYDTERLIEIVFTVGGYTMTGLAINSFGVQVEEGHPGFPEV